MTIQELILMVLFFCLFIILSLSLFFRYKQEVLAQQLIVLALVFLAFAGHRFSVDYGNHLAMYNEAVGGILRHEVSYYLISRIVNYLFGTPVLLFFIYAVLSVTIKYNAISKLTEFVFPSLLIYFSYFFILHDVTQIRAAVASAFVLMSITTIPERKKYNFFVFSFMAILFHYSALIILPLILLSHKRIQKIYYFMIPLGFLLWSLNINISRIISLIDFEPIRIKYQTYLQLAENENVNLHNLVFIARILFCYVLLWKWEYLAEKSMYSTILIKVYIISIFALIVFSDIPTLAFRVSELFGIVEIILLPYILWIVKGRTLSKIILISVSFIFLCLVLLYERLILF